MDNQKFLYAVFVMAGVMLGLKLIPLMFLKKKIQNKFLKSFLAYVPYAVLTSMTFPEVFRSTSNVYSATIGIVLAVVLSYLGKSLVVVALSSTATVFIVERLIELIK